MSSVEITADAPVTNWFRDLQGDRLEVCLQDKERGLRFRASGRPDEIWRMVELFEELTGREVVGDWRRPPRTGKRPLDGQLTIQLESSPNGAR